jgi:photosystem II stability/assembly factor-like uncharacterized protein
MPLTALAFLVLMACSDAEDTADTSTPGTEPAACGDLSDGPAPATDAWGPTASQPPAGGLFNLVHDPLSGTLYAGSHNAGLWRSDDEGATWEQMPVLISHTMSDLLVPAGHADELLRSSGGWLEQSLDGGRTWKPLDLGDLSQPGPSQMVLALGGAGYDGDRVYALTSDGLIWRSTDDAQNFDPVGSVPVTTERDDLQHFLYLGRRLLGDALEGDALILATEQGLFRSVDGGDSWSLALDGELTGSTLVRDPADSAHLVVAGAGGMLHLSWDNGETWESQGVAEDLTGTHFSADGGTLWLVGETSLLTSNDGGRTLQSQAVTFQDPRAVFETETGRLYVADDNGISATEDTGGSWFESEVGMADLGMAVIAVHPTCPNRLMTASRCSGGLFTSQDWGRSWAHVAGHFHYVMGVHHDPSDPEHLWSVTDDALYESVDGGGSWTLTWTRYHYHGFAVHPEDPQMLLLGSVGDGEYADDNGWVYRSEDGGQTWGDSGGGLPDNDASMHALLYWPGDPEVVLLATYKGGGVSHQSGEGIGLWRSTDGGRYWSLVALDVADVSWLTETPTGVAAATEDGLWHSTDKGVTWVQLEGPQGFLLSVDFVGDTGLTVEREGMTWRTTDGGESWTAIDTGTFWDPMGWLSTIAISADASMAWLTIYSVGVYQIGLE